MIIFEFQNGPAQDHRMKLKRAPMFLRVVVDRKSKKVDALDLLEDTPEPDEDIYVYQRQPEVVRGFMDSRGNGGYSGPFQSYHYKLLYDQPPDDIMRNTFTWQRWCTSRSRPQK